MNLGCYIEMSIGESGLCFRPLAAIELQSFPHLRYPMHTFETAVGMTSFKRFRNNVRALLKMYPVLREIDSVVSKSLVKPIFVSLGMLMDADADDKDIQTMAELLLEDGQMLAKLRPSECDKLVMNARHCLCEKTLSVESRRQLLRVSYFV
ncbi:unnamed protein product [Toxocara canis]|uniref:Uncharacterized protein n=1 Tax=Toxocara canis TaxID=6265 RepID=A0A3P7G8J3_TOXCA|nr:unnamed protein product [Toxocara canis]